MLNCCSIIIINIISVEKFLLLNILFFIFGETDIFMIFDEWKVQVWNKTFVTLLGLEKD